MTANKMWGGRFERGPAAIMEDINVSIDFDKRLAMQDLAGSKAHAAMLTACGIIGKADARAIHKGLNAIEREIKNRQLSLPPRVRGYPSQHRSPFGRIDRRSGGTAAYRARSRNDQVATDLAPLRARGLRQARFGASWFSAGAAGKGRRAHRDHHAGVHPYARPAQPVSFAHHCLAYVEMAERDRGRFADAAKRMNESPLGAAALAGTPYKIDRKMSAKALGFGAPMRNSLDAVSARDFALEFLSASAIASANLSRLAEEIVLWSSPAYGFVRLSDSFSSGSSIMPQKRNPDAAELVRAKTGRILGAFVGLLTVVKGLPLAYAKDLQEDKEPVFAALDALELSLAAMTGMMSELTIDAAAMETRRREGLSHRHRSRRLVGEDLEKALPRSPPSRGARRETRRSLGRRLGRTQLERFASHRAQTRQGCL